MFLNLKNYDLVFTTSFEHTHGVSGHLYEMIDYFYVATMAGIKCAVLLSDGTTKSTLHKAITDKYTFDPDIILYHTVEYKRPNIIMAKQLCIVDGAPRYFNCVIYAEHVWLLRCFAHEFSYFNNHKTIKRTTLLQDFNLYDERYEHLNIDVVDYTKKILWTSYKQPILTKTNTALLYLTTLCKGIDVSSVKEIISKYQYEKYIIATNDVNRYKSLISDNVIIEQVPINNIFEKFDTYIYTATPRQFDCSPRFIVECAVYNKDVIYELDYVDRGVECRRNAIQKDLQSLLLTEDDDFFARVKNECNKS